MIEFGGYEPKELIICGANTPDVIKYLTNSGMVDLGGTGNNIHCNFTYKNMPKYETLQNGWFFRSKLEHPHYEDWANEQWSIISTYDIFLDYDDEHVLLFPAIEMSEILNILPLFNLNAFIPAKSLELHQMAYDEIDFSSFTV